MATYALPGNQIYIDKIAKMVERSENMYPVMDAMVSAFVLIEHEKFANGGPGWAPLAQTTVDFKASNGFSDQILIRTGELWDSMVGRAGFTESVTNYGWEYRSNVSHAWEHQQGVPEKNLPARPIVDLTPGVVAMFKAMMETYLVSGTVMSPGHSDVSGIY